MWIIDKAIRITRPIFFRLGMTGCMVGVLGLVAALVLHLLGFEVMVGMGIAGVGLAITGLSIVSMLPAFLVILIVTPISLLLEAIAWLRIPYEGNRFLNYLKRAWKNRGKTSEFNNVMSVMGFLLLSPSGFGNLILDLCRASDASQATFLAWTTAPALVGIVMIVANLSIADARFEREQREREANRQRQKDA